MFFTIALLNLLEIFQLFDLLLFKSGAIVCFIFIFVFLKYYAIITKNINMYIQSE